MSLFYKTATCEEVVRRALPTMGYVMRQTGNTCGATYWGGTQQGRKSDVKIKPNTNITQKIVPF